MKEFLAKHENLFKSIKNKLPDKELFHFAASLSFNTLLSIIPFIFISLSIFMKMPSFSGYYAKIKNFIFSNLLPNNKDAVSLYIDQFLANSSSLGIMGLIAVIFTSVMFFADFEYVVSKITKSEQRPFWSSFSTYWTLITLMPLGLGLSFWLSGLVQKTLSSNNFTNEINFLAIFPYIVIWVIFSISYRISINRKLSSKNLLLASFISSAIWEISKIIFIQYAFYNKTYESIYGSFSVLLFFFLWIYISWIIFLYGAKLCMIFEGNHEEKSQNIES